MSCRRFLCPPWSCTEPGWVSWASGNRASWRSTFPGRAWPRGHGGVLSPRLAVRTGLHTGECELVDGKAGGIAVHIGARVASLADPGEVLVSSTVKDLVAGSGIEFEDRGEHQLKGISEAWRLFTVVP